MQGPWCVSDCVPRSSLCPSGDEPAGLLRVPIPASYCSKMGRGGELPEGIITCNDKNVPLPRYLPCFLLRYKRTNKKQMLVSIKILVSLKTRPRKPNHFSVFFPPLLKSFILPSPRGKFQKLLRILFWEKVTADFIERLKSAKFTVSIGRPLILRNLICFFFTKSNLPSVCVTHTPRAITPTMCQECRFSDLRSPLTFQGHFQRREAGPLRSALPLLLRLLLESSGHRAGIKMVTARASSALMSNGSHSGEPGQVGGNKFLPRRPGTPSALSTTL